MYNLINDVFIYDIHKCHKLKSKLLTMNSVELYIFIVMLEKQLGYSIRLH